MGGDLVQYWTHCEQGGVGLVVEVDSKIEDSMVLANTRVRWTNHAGFEREWYRKDELVKLQSH